MRRAQFVDLKAHCWTLFRTYKSVASNLFDKKPHPFLWGWFAGRAFKKITVRWYT